MGKLRFQRDPAASERIPASRRPLRHIVREMLPCERSLEVSTRRSQSAVTEPRRVVAMAGSVLRRPSGSRVCS